jgi:Tol biopolymer transport system component
MLVEPANRKGDEVGLVSADSLTLRRVRVPKLDYGATEKTICWAPDGRRIAVGGRSEDLDYGEVHVVNVGSARRWVVVKMLIEDGMDIAYPAWSPDGGSIAFGLSGTSDLVGKRKDVPTGQVFVLDLRSRKVRRVYRGQPVANLAWSPNGQLLALRETGWIRGKEITRILVLRKQRAAFTRVEVLSSGEVT